MKSVPKIIVDTNIILSGYIYGGKPRLILQLAAKKEIEIITSLQILAECVDVLRKKFKVDDKKIAIFQAKIENLFTFVTPKETISIVKRDPDDNKFIEAAVEGNCGYIITGDCDLLDLRQYKSIKIISANEFLENLEG